MENRKVIIGRAQGEIIEKKSRFIASIFEIHSEAEALEHLEAIRKQYYDARHNCYAYVLGAHSELQRFSDDREPQGTAGRPILEVINGSGFHNVLIVVTRYFGGILLGTGGLVRAYTFAAQEGLSQAEISGSCASVITGIPVNIICDYTLSGKVQYIVSQNDIPVEDIVYAADVTFRLAVPLEDKESFIARITEATNAAAVIETGDPFVFSVVNSRPVPYEF